MRQDVPIRSRSSNFARCLSISSVWLLCVGMVGCQLTPPPARTANHQLGSRFSAEPSPSDGAVGRGANGSNATYKPADESASAAPITPASQASGPPVLSAGAQIRGQSGSGDYYNGWNSGTAGGSDSYRQPMVATEANRYVQPGYPVATTPSQLPQTAGTLPPPPGTAAPNTVLQPPVGQIPSAQPYGYGAPSRNGHATATRLRCAWHLRNS
ncbi:MAG: hypothetical protein R3C53_11995 [Pirellulaceae bacterium]